MKEVENRQIQEAAEVIRKGGLVLFPTETVYGIGADGLNEEAVRKIFKAKGRAQDNPLILHIDNMDMLNLIAKDISELEYKLMDAFWPGPFTIVLNKKECVPNAVTGGLDTVAVRMPKNIIANKLISYSKTPIAAPSANISGRPSGTCIEDIYDELKDSMDYIIDGGKCEVGIESTVVKVDSGKVRILRPGRITKEDIEQVVSSVILDEHIMGTMKEGEKVLSPGMKYKHYAPTASCIIISSQSDNMLTKKILELSRDYSNVIVICSDELKSILPEKTCLSYGRRNDLTSIASNIFSLLRRADNMKPDLIIVEGMEDKGIGLAIMNRLIRACSHRYYKI